MRILPLAEAKSKLSQLVTDATDKEEEITITRNGRAAAVLVSYDEFQRWKETEFIIADPSFLADIRRGIRDLAKGRGRSYRRKEDLDALFGLSDRPRRKRK